MGQEQCGLVGEVGQQTLKDLMDQGKGFGSNSGCDGKPLNGRTQEREMVRFICCQGL